MGYSQERRQACLDGGLFPDAGADPAGWSTREKFTVAAMYSRSIRNRSPVPTRLTSEPT